VRNWCFVQQLRGCAKVGHSAKDKAEVQAALRERVALPAGGLCLPTSPAHYVSELLVEKCAAMSSATKPLRLVFKNAPGWGPSAPPRPAHWIILGWILGSYIIFITRVLDKVDHVDHGCLSSAVLLPAMPMSVCVAGAGGGGAGMSGAEGSVSAVIFKDGDDLRQDGLCLQAFGMMEALWAEAGLDIPLTVYAAVDMGGELGMLEMVADCETISSISQSRKAVS
jgi:hypothetical protein